MNKADEHRQLISNFYTAFANKDSLGMKACYHQHVVFEDPVFGVLKEEEVAAMWEMLLSRGKDLIITFSDVKADDFTGTATWVATYTFSRSGRQVINHIQAQFSFADGKIIKHTDSFDLNKWFIMAFGLKGYLFITLPFLRRKFSYTVKQSLVNYMAKRQ